MARASYHGGMEKLAICRSCHFAFSFRPMGLFAPSLADSAPAFCTRCGKEALVAAGDFGGFFAAYHEAFPAVLSKKQKLDVLDVARRIVAGQIKEDRAELETKKDPVTRNAFRVAGEWLGRTIGAAGSLASVAAVVIMLSDQEEKGALSTAKPREPEASGKPQKAPTSSRRGSRAQAQPETGAQPKDSGKTRIAKKKRKHDPDVPLS